MAMVGVKLHAAEASLLRYKQKKERLAPVMAQRAAKIRVQSEVVRSEKRKAERAKEEGRR